MKTKFFTSKLSNEIDGKKFRTALNFFSLTNVRKFKMRCRIKRDERY